MDVEVNSTAVVDLGQANGANWQIHFSPLAKEEIKKNK